MRVRWFGSSVVAVMALCAALGVGATAAPSSPSGLASATAPAERSVPQAVANPVDCPVVPGRYAENLVIQADATVVLHRFDGNVLDDLRVPIPASFRNIDNLVKRYGLSISPDCRTVIAAHNLGSQALRIDVATGAVQPFRFAVPVEPFAAPYASAAAPLNPSIFFLPDHQLVTVDTADTVRLVNVMDGSDAASWATSAPEGLRIVDRSGRALHFVLPSPSGLSVESLLLADSGSDTVASRYFPGSYTDVTDIQIAASGSRVLLSHSADSGQAVVTVFDLSGTRGVLGSIAAESGRFASDDGLLICRSDGLYRSNLSGDVTLIEPFDDTFQSPQNVGPPLPFSPKQLACRTAVQSG